MLCSSADLSLQQYLDGTDPQTPLAPTSHHPPTLLTVETFRMSHWAIPSHWDKSTPFFELNSLIMINHELPDHQNYSWGGGCHQLPGQYASVGFRHLPLSGWVCVCAWVSISTGKMWLWRVWATFSANGTRRSRKAPSVSWNAKPVLQLSSFQDVQKPSQEWVR